MTINIILDTYSQHINVILVTINYLLMPISGSQNVTNDPYDASFNPAEHHLLGSRDYFRVYPHTRPIMTNPILSSHAKSTVRADR